MPKTFEANEEWSSSSSFGLFYMAPSQGPWFSNLLPRSGHWCLCSWPNLHKTHPQCTHKKAPCTLKPAPRFRISAVVISDCDPTNVKSVTQAFTTPTNCSKTWMCVCVCVSVRWSVNPNDKNFLIYVYTAGGRFALTSMQSRTPCICDGRGNIVIP